MQKLKDWFYSLQQRERLMVLGGGVLVALVAIYILGLAPFYKAVDMRAQRIAKKEADLAWLQSVAPEVAALAAQAPPGQPSNESLVVLIDRTARECGLSSALTGQTPNGDTGIRVRLEGAEFDKVMLCLANLQQVHAVSIESATFDRTAKAGYVNASLVLNRAGG